MTELNYSQPIKITNCKPFSFELELDTTNFNAYTRQGTVEDIKVPKKMPFDSLFKSTKNPVASSAEGMLAVPDLSKFGRAE